MDGQRTKAREHTDIDSLCVKSLQMLALDMVQKANSGHPGAPLGAAEMTYVLWERFLKHNPANPRWPDRDRFVLSPGHACAMLYSLLHLTGYDLPMSELKNFRQWGSKTPGHSEVKHTPGVETTTGPLGQGFVNAVGFALAEAHLAAIFNKPGFPVVDHFTYAVVSDGDLMEGITAEAASFAGHLGLGKLIFLYDDNHITIEGKTEMTFTEDVEKRFEAYGWHVQRLKQCQRDHVERAIRVAQAATDKPSLIIVRTHIGIGSPLQDSCKVHGEPLNAEHYKQTREHYGFGSVEPFHTPPAALSHFRKALKRGAAHEDKWIEMFQEYARKYPEEAGRFKIMMSGELPAGWDEGLPKFDPAKPMATRSASGEVLNKIADQMKGQLIGGSADLGPSNKTTLKNHADIDTRKFEGSNIHFGIREHAMAAISNGLSLHGGVIPFCATFLQFYDYMRPAVRLACIMKTRVIFVYTHDSIGLGEDGPTHQPVEHLAAMRAVPRLVTIRPADANETVYAWRYALARADGPTAICLTRQNLPVFDRAVYPPADGLLKGAYVLVDGSKKPDAILIASGSEVALAVEAAKLLKADKIKARVVSMPSWEIFDKQPQHYRDSVLPPTIRARVAIEAASPFGWSKWIGPEGATVTVNDYGASAPAEIIYEKLGLTAANIAQTAKRVIKV